MRKVIVIGVLLALTVMFLLDAFIELLVGTDKSALLMVGAAIISFVIMLHHKHVTNKRRKDMGVVWLRKR